MFQSYEQIFSKRANAYQKAMELYPAARQREFQLAVERAGLTAADVICDAPSGGGYLRAYLPADIGRYLAVETAPDFTVHCPLGKHDRTVRSPLDDIAIENNSVDACINLAGSHHLHDKSRFFSEARRILKPGGRLVLADAEKGTRVDRFLNGFVDRHSSMGHDGIFLDESTAAEITGCGFRVHDDELIGFPWAFETRKDIGIFCKLLFGIDLAAADDVLAGTEEILGYMPGPGEFNLAWSLRYIVAIKR